MTGYRNEPDPFKASEAAYLLARTAAALSLRRKSVSSVQESAAKVRSLIVTAIVSGEPRRSRIASSDGRPAAAYQTRRNWFTNY